MKTTDNVSISNVIFDNMLMSIIFGTTFYNKCLTKLIKINKTNQTNYPKRPSPSIIYQIINVSQNNLNLFVYQFIQWIK